MRKSRTTNDSNIYHYGDTVRFECSFADFEGNKVNPDLVKIVIYDYRYNIIFEGEGKKKNEVGEYFFDYTTERKDQRLYYEWYGEVDGRPSLKRGEITTKFIL